MCVRYIDLHHKYFKKDKHFFPLLISFNISHLSVISVSVLLKQIHFRKIEMLTAFVNPMPLRHLEAGESLFAGSAVEKRSGEQREEVAWPSRKSRLVPCGCPRMYKVKLCCCQLLNNIQSHFA